MSTTTRPATVSTAATARSVKSVRRSSMTELFSFRTRLVGHARSVADEEGNGRDERGDEEQPVAVEHPLGGDVAVALGKGEWDLGRKCTAGGGAASAGGRRRERGTEHPATR